MSFGERSSPTAAIAAILSAYPCSVGLLREFLQNSDDAKASTQVSGQKHLVSIFQTNSWPGIRSRFPNSPQRSPVSP
ncbi:hypothetical protein HWV62_20792 [Athelia sp. TMB]|nr:hypothetical protein HWV62_20792 [Athelia sp. TMB]